LPELSVEEPTRQANLFYGAVAQCHTDAREGFDGMRSVLSWLWEAAMQPLRPGSIAMVRARCASRRTVYSN